jgi:hypothetical protein
VNCGAIGAAVVLSEAIIVAAAVVLAAVAVYLLYQDVLKPLGDVARAAVVRVECNDAKAAAAPNGFTVLSSTVQVPSTVVPSEHKRAPLARRDVWRRLCSSILIAVILLSVDWLPLREGRREA